jgi:cyclic pyranopterin phosphate synthase
MKSNHFSSDGRPVMVDVSAKSVTARRAVAQGCVLMSPSALEAALAGSAKGNVLAVAQLAGIMGAKRTADLIPLCHPLPLDGVNVRIDVLKDRSGLAVEADASTFGRTGVEMEAITAVMVTCLTVYDMLKALDRGIVISDVRLIEKTGGASGHWRSEAP